MKLIGFTGKMGSGKSTAIQHLKDKYTVCNIKFAQPLYDIQEYAYRRIHDVYTRPADFVKDRKLLQFLGTEWGRGMVGDTVWVDLWKKEISNRGQYNSLFEVDELITCDDIRFDNEAEAIKALGGILVRIESDKANQRIDTTSGIVNHPSEQGISEKYIDFTIENNDSIKEFEAQIDLVYSTCYGK